MTTPTSPLQQQVDTAQDLIGQASALWVAAAEQSDSATGLGTDGRIQLVHGLVDLWVKGLVVWLEAFITSGGFFSFPPQATEPLPSDVIEVPSATTYARQIEAIGPFVRVGMPTVTIPKSAIGFNPPSLPAGITQFQVFLKDYNLIGANYTGTIRLSTQSLVPDDRVVTVGL